MIPGVKKSFFVGRVVIVNVGAIVLGTHSPGMFVRAAEVAAKREEQELRTFLASAGYTVTVEEAKEVLQEAASAATQKDMAALATDLGALLPHLPMLADGEGL